MGFGVFMRVCCVCCVCVTMEDDEGWLYRAERYSVVAIEAIVGI